MSGTVLIPFGSDAAATAAELLALAGDHPERILTSSTGFVVPAAIAKTWPGEDARGRAPVPPGAYDPAVHSAAEVCEYLAGASLDEAERVHYAERNGKNRKTIAEWRPAEGATVEEG